MHKETLEYGKRAAKEFFAIPDPSCDQIAKFSALMQGLKDFAETEYKATIITEMKEAKEEDEIMAKMNDRMGYTDRMRRCGYRPYMNEDMYMQEYIDDPSRFKANMRMGYNHEVSDKGRAYDDYVRARKYYTESHTPESMTEMENALTKMFDEIEAITTDAMRDLEPSKRQKYMIRLQNMGR